ncbi:hypothetical protein VB618_18560 [Microvirga sp. CF3062]|uniref:hypothetical protein n=1 Tax=Microvirga sp. CF3062 TaxID=3110182 RepID=UPI002E788DDA|nr:hypothetical protein [Microvirga sp. CF3062]MEE1658205.1 hypothetical protein [Microvirga sp. CF3062]
MNRVWTEEEIDILRRDREAKVPVPVTAAKLGRPVPATYARARLIGTLVQPHQSWDEGSAARLRELVCADLPMTDKRIAAELGRSVTQIRWKMQDLGLIGVRDLSKLAKITAAESARPKASRASSAGPASRKTSARPELVRQSNLAQSVDPTPSIVTAPLTHKAFDPQAALEHAIKALAAIMADRLKSSIAQSEAGMIKAARAAIAEKGRIDQRLVIRAKRATETETRRLAAAGQAEIEAKKAAADAKRQEVETRKAEAKAKRLADEVARPVREQKAREERSREKAQVAASVAVEKSKPVEKKAVLSAVQGVSRNATSRPAPQPVASPVSKIVVMEAPAPVRPVEVDQTAAPISGRGGWKSVRRDPARVMAQGKAKAKPANRADAVDLAQAAQTAIERFIAERGVTRTESSGVQLVVSRLQARGYIVVRDEAGWTIDQRHRIASESDLMAFADARGITLSAAA